MYTHPLFISWTLLLVTIATLHILALKFSLYWMYPWFDIMIHFLGGLFVALSVLWFLFESKYIRLNKSVRNTIFVAGSSIILVGVGWEIFEIFAGIPIEEDFILDTTIDLTMGVLGAIVAGFIFIKIYLTRNGKEHEEQQKEQ